MSVAVIIELGYRRSIPLDSAISAAPEFTTAVSISTLDQKVM